jgi:hypothetical protein
MHGVERRSATAARHATAPAAGDGARLAHSDGRPQLRERAESKEEERVESFGVAMAVKL